MLAGIYSILCVRWLVIDPMKQQHVCGTMEDGSQWTMEPLQCQTLTLTPSLPTMHKTHGCMQVAMQLAGIQEDVPYKRIYPKPESTTDDSVEAHSHPSLCISLTMHSQQEFEIDPKAISGPPCYHLYAMLLCIPLALGCITRHLLLTLLDALRHFCQN